MKAFIVISIIFVVLIWLYIARNWKEGAKFYVPKVHKELLETFAVLGGLNDVRYGRLGSTVHNTGTLGKWIKVASFTNVNPMQNHALTLEVFPQNKGLGTSKQSFSFLVRNSNTDQDGDPVFIQQNQYDGTNWTEATFTTASVVRTQDAKNKLSNTYSLYLQLGTENAFGIPVTWYLNDFMDADVIAVGDVDQVDSLPAGTSVYKPRVINQDQLGETGTVFANRICNPAGDRCLNLSDAENLTAAALAAAAAAKAAAAPAVASLRRWPTRDYVVWSTSDTDLPGNPINATLQQCQEACARQSSCLGFSRGKQVSDTGYGDCYLKKRLSPEATGSNWQTFVK